MKSSYEPDWKKTAKRRKASRDTWVLLRERLQRVYGKCQACKDAPGSEAHHLVPKAQSGADEFANLAWLCQDCHRNVTEWTNDARARLRGHLSRVQLGYLLDTAGEAWTTDNYPLAEEPDAAGLLSERESMRGDAPPRPSRLDGSRSNWWGRPVPGWASKQDLDSLFLDCLLILQRMDAPVVKKGSGEAYSVLELVFRDFIDRYREYLPKGEAA